MLLFDFDGTLADSLYALLECVNDNADYYGYKKITAAESLRNKDALSIIKELGISVFKLPFVVSTIRKQMNTKISAIEPFPGIPDVLKQLHENGVVLGIITSNSQENVKIFLQNNNINFFTYIIGQNSIFGKGRAIKKFLHNNGINPADVIYIGDEVRDIQAAKQNGIKSAAITWGFNDLAALQAQKPDFIINKPEDLRELLS